MTAADLGEWAKPTLRGERVTLRPYEPADVDPSWELVNDPVGAELTGTSATFTYAQVRDWVLSRPVAPERLDLVIVENATGEFAGEVVLNEHAAATRSANLRIVLRGPAWYGRGLGSEAVALVVEHAFERVGLAALTLDVRADNAGAIRSYEKVGFTEIGRAVEDCVTWVDMMLTREEWRAR